MRNYINHLAIIAILSAVLPAQAAVQNYNFSGAIDSGIYNGETFSGNFSFDDDNIVTDTFGLGVANLLDVNMSFLSTNFTLANSLVAPDVSFQDGAFLGLSWSVDSTSPDIGFTFTPGFSTLDEAFIGYTSIIGNRWRR